jgi:hypothetical protein
MKLGITNFQFPITNGTGQAYTNSRRPISTRSVCSLVIGNWKLVILAFALAPTLGIAATVDLKSGPQVGDRALPFTSNQVTGENRGRQYCYICEMGDRPAVLVFARHMDEPTARLLRDLRQSMRLNRQQKLFAWMVFLGGESTDSETALEGQAYEFARKNGALSVALSALGDPLGPPGYRIATDAEITVLALRSGKVLYNRAYRAKEWSSKAAESALKTLPSLLQSP